MTCSTCGGGGASFSTFGLINPLATCPGGVSVPITQDGSNPSGCNGITVAGTCINQTMLIAAVAVTAVAVGAVVVMKMKGGKKQLGSAYNFGGY